MKIVSPSKYKDTYINLESVSAIEPSYDHCHGHGTEHRIEYVVYLNCGKKLLITMAEAGHWFGIMPYGDDFYDK